MIQYDKVSNICHTYGAYIFTDVQRKLKQTTEFSAVLQLPILTESFLQFQFQFPLQIFKHWKQADWNYWEFSAVST